MREERAIDLKMILKKKEVEVEEERKKIHVTSSTLKTQEEDYKVRSTALTVREKEESQKLLDVHNAILDAKQQAFEMEMDKKRRSFNEELNNTMDMLDKNTNIIRCKEEQLLNRENTLEIKAGELKTKEARLASKLKGLKEWEDSLKTIEKLLQEKSKHLKYSNEIETSWAKHHNEKIAIEAEVQKSSLRREISK